MKRESLKKIVIDVIKERFPAVVSIDEIHAIAKSLNKRESNVERRLRSSESPMIQAIRQNPHDHLSAIIGYRYMPGRNEAMKKNWWDDIELNENQEKYCDKKFEGDLERTAGVRFSEGNFIGFAQCIKALAKIQDKYGAVS